MELIISPQAAKDLRGMPKADAKRILEALKQVADSDPGRMPFVTELVGQPSYWRLRKGDWRAVYFIDGDEMVVTTVQKRSEVYR